MHSLNVSLKAKYSLIAIRRFSQHQGLAGKPGYGIRIKMGPVEPCTEAKNSRARLLELDDSASIPL